MHIQPGQTVGRYHIEEQIGEGGMAVVFKAYDTRLERPVAFKILRVDGFPSQEMTNLLKRFEREAVSLANLSHPNIVGVIDYGDYEGSPYLVLEYLAGGTLKDSLGKPWDFKVAARGLIPIANALAYAHSRGIVHRDVKPSNILIADGGEPMLTDFGIAKILEDSGGSTLTGTGVAIGTPEYMAPEQGMGKVVDARADVYALGVVFYELVTGRSPYQADTPLAVIFKHMTEALPRPRLFVPDLPAEVEEVLFKALAKDPDNRYQDMTAFAEALRNLERAEFLATIRTPGRAEPMMETGRTAVTSGSSSEPTLMSQKKQLPAPRRHVPVWVWLLPVVVLIFLGGMIWGQSYLVGSATTPPAPSSQPVDRPTQEDPPTSEPQPSKTPAKAEAANPTDEPSPTAVEQAEWVANPLGEPVVFVPAGEFIRGLDEGDALAATQEFLDETPLRYVYLDDFWIDQTEVTNAMFARFVAETNYQTDAERRGSSYVFFSSADGFDQIEGADWLHPFGPSSSSEGLENYPVVHVSWNDASAYCAWAGQRLPTEAEWEKAARGSEGLTYPWGNREPAGNLANLADVNLNATWNDRAINDRFQFAAPVGSYPEGASPYGVLDMAGNVWEWVQDWYAANYYAGAPSGNPTGPGEGEFRSIRGGSWLDGALSLRASNRAWNNYALLLDEASNYIGFRCAVSP